MAPFPGTPVDSVGFMAMDKMKTREKKGSLEHKFWHFQKWDYSKRLSPFSSSAATSDMWKNIPRPDFNCMTSELINPAGALWWHNFNYVKSFFPSSMALLFKDIISFWVRKDDLYSNNDGPGGIGRASKGTSEISVFGLSPALDLRQ